MGVSTQSRPILRRFIRHIPVSVFSSSRNSISRRVPARIFNDDGTRYYPRSGQGMTLIEMFNCLKEKDRIRAWAYKNAYTLLFLMCMFVVTWLIMVAQSYHWIGR